MIPLGFFARYTMHSGNFNAMCIKWQSSKNTNGEIVFAISPSRYLVIFFVARTRVELVTSGL